MLSKIIFLFFILKMRKKYLEMKRKHHPKGFSDQQTNLQFLNCSTIIVMKISNTTLQARMGRNLSIYFVIILLVAPIVDLHSLLRAIPFSLQAGIILAIAVYFIRKLLTFPRWNDELQYCVPFVKAVIYLLVIIVIENFLTWATSASDLHKYEYTPLQDNVEIVTLWAFQKYPLIKTLILGWQADMHILLYAFVGLCLSVIWDQVPYSGFGMGARFMDVITWTHWLRTAAFMITVLPNPKPHCYYKNFPPVPSSVWEFIAIGFGKKRGSGCNDLVISGHGVVYAAVPLAITTFYRPADRRLRGIVSFLSWGAVTKLCLQEVVDKTHYSVDMLLAVACTALIWKWREEVYPATALVKQRRQGSKADPVPRTLIALTVGVLILVFVGVQGV